MQNASREEYAPPRIAWARRLLLLAAALLVADYCVYDWGDIYGPYLADRHSASAEIAIADLKEDQIQAAYQRALAAHPLEGFLTLVDADSNRRRYEVRLTAPTREQALEHANTFIAKFAGECRATPGKVYWTTVSSYALPELSPTAGVWLGRLKLGLLVAGCAALAAGVLLYLGPRKLGL